MAALPEVTSRGYGIAAYVDGLQSAGRVDEALELTDSAVAAARELGNPYWISYTLWIVGLAISKVDSKRALLAWDEGVEFVREHRVRFFEGFIGRDAARLHTSEGEPEAALALFGPAIESFHQAGNVPQLIITLASVPALFERVGRLDAAATLLGALSRESASFHHVPELVDLGDRLTAQLGEERSRELTSAGATLDLNDAAAYAREQIELARKTLDPAGTPHDPCRPDSSRGRRAATDRRGESDARDRRAAVHLVEDRGQPHPAHLHEARRHQPRRGDPLGHRTRARQQHCSRG